MNWRKAALVMGAVLMCTCVLASAESAKQAPSATALNMVERVVKPDAEKALPAQSPAGLARPQFQLAPTSAAGVAQQVQVGQISPVGTRQGGDTCADAVVISTLPYNDTGTTVGYANDYTPTCQSSNAPDVVYAFTPAADMAIDVTLCNGTDFDSVLYITDGCAGPEVGCNDDSCGLQSELTGVALIAGHTYYIVVDAYSANSGNYTIDVTEGVPPPPPPQCPVDALYGQYPHTPDQGWSFGTSGITSSFNYRVYDNFTGVTSPMCDIHWWGVSLAYTGSGWANCDPANLTQFEIKFYEDAAGMPGTEVCSYTVTPTYTSTGLLYNGFEQWYFEVPNLLPCCVLPAGWVSIQSLQNTSDCTFLWASGPVQLDGISYQHDGTQFSQTAFDRGFCLTGEYVPVFGACCDDLTGTCTDNVELINCLPPLRFAANTACADLSPACGEILGACCMSDGTCQLTTQANCAENWLGANTTCEQCPCITPCPEGGVAEGEPECYPNYVDVTNGGCNSVPPVFGTITPGVTICGFSGTYTFNGSNYRDTDWFEINVTTSSIFRFTVDAEFPVVFGLLEQTIPGVPGCDNMTGYIAPYLSAQPCTPGMVETACLPAGTYYFLVAPSVFSGLPCNVRYRATLEVETCIIPIGACCLPDGTCIPDLTVEQCDGYEGAWQGQDVPCQPGLCPDLTGACCMFDGTCIPDSWESACAAQGGTFWGAGTVCDPNPCPGCEPDYVVTVPGVYSGTTCGMGNDCPLRGSEEVIYQVNIAEAGTYIFDTCTGTSWDTYLFLGTSCCGAEIAQNDDACGAQSLIEAYLEPGTYYVTLEAYSTTVCGDYALNMAMLEPCILEQPAGSTPEGEPLCGENYVDTHNGGCNSVPNVFQPIACGETIFGESGTYTYMGSGYRDTDWYQVEITSGKTFTLAVEAEFDVLFGLIEQAVPGVPGCDNITGYVSPSVNAQECDPQSIVTDCLPAGTYYFFVAPSSGATVPCGAKYIATLTCADCVPPEPPANDLCEDAICLAEGTITTSSVLATGTDVSSCAYNDVADIWFTYTPRVSGSVQVDTNGSAFDTTLAIYDACGGTEFDCDDDGGEGTQSLIVLEMTAGVEYVIRVAGYNTGTGNVVLTITGGGGVCICGDYDMDGVVGASDYFLFLDALGHCSGDPRYFVEADFDLDGCVTLVDFQAWMQCYRDANGRDFRRPMGQQKKAVIGGGPSLAPRGF